MKNAATCIWYFQLEKLTLHKVPVFREPEDDESDKENENEGSSQPSQSEKQPGIDDLTELEKFTPEQLKVMSSDELAAMLQKEEEFLKSLSPNLNTLQDYEKKVSFVRNIYWKKKIMKNP